MFRLPVVEVPTNLPNIRKDLPIQAFAVGISASFKCIVLLLFRDLLLENNSYVLITCRFRLHVANGIMSARRLSICSDWVDLF